MLEQIREGSKGFWALAVLGLVILSFIFTGVGGYLTASGNDAAAEVNGEPIPLSELERAYQNERARMESQFGESFAALFAEEDYLATFRAGVLDRLIADKLLEQYAADAGMRVSDEQIRDAILQMPEFQLGGQFNNERYLAILRQAGYQPSAFRDYLRAQMTREQVARAVAASEFTLPGEAKRAHALEQQTRDARFVIVPADPFAASVDVSDEERNAYYQNNISQFDTQEQVSLAFVELRADDLKPNQTVSEQEVEEYYQLNGAEFRTDEERRVSHILVEFGEDEDAAQSEAEALLQRITAGEDFADVAAAESDDTFSAENGGDLEWLTEGMMDPAFEAAAFALSNVGDITDVVRSEFGFHIIKLTDLKPEQITPLEEVAAELRERIVTNKAVEEFYNIQQRMAEVAFEVPDSLNEVAAVANKEIQTTPLFSRQSPPNQVNNPLLLSAAFSDDVLEGGLNSDLIELDDEHVIVIRVVEHKPQRTRTLDEVSEKITATLIAEKAQQAAKTWAQELKAKLDEQQDVGELLQQQSLEWQEQSAVARYSGQLPPNLSEALFTLAPGAGQDTQVVELGSGDVGLVQVTAVNQADMPQDDALASLQQRLASSRSQALYSDMIDSMRSRADVRVFN
ncbi:SurA N-terminal domain-containing protein [Aestuariibacter salexigens]|uniref:SurA N-terminal domain-containing protein n=1 Tax=Aestuariibacter salexigens TaxID=226010 RepID=UPI0003F6845E|nr:SurA N-terminal domain-containing protein [Aestuariibacter salexigens]